MVKTPKFEIIQGDVLYSLEALRLQGRQFDALVADPPYCSGGMNPADVLRGHDVAKYCNRTDLGTFSDSMSQRAFMWFTRHWLNIAHGLLKSPGYVFIFIDWRQLPTVSDALQAAGYVWRGVAAWDKKNCRPNAGHISQTCEFIVWGTKDAAKSDKYLHKGCIVQPAPKNDDRIHPTQKSVEVIDQLLSILPDDAQAVLDPFSGSASTGVAALGRGLDYVGIEAQPGFIEASRGRLAASLEILEKTGVFVDAKRAANAPKLF